MATNKESKREIALKRWKYLGQMLASKTCTVDGDANSFSVRRFASFGLLETKLCSEETEVDEQHSDNTRNLWYNYTCEVDSKTYSALIRYLDNSISIQTLLGFNNTGNVCVWPSEEVLTYFCLNKLPRFSGKRVCELGGGMTCLAGVFLAICSDADEILLTDGNEKSLANIQQIVKKNRVSFGQTKVTSRLLRWNEDETFENLCEYFDIIICADCLFFDEYQQDLVQVIEFLLKPQGEAIIFAPARGDTFGHFKDLAVRRFSLTHTSHYDTTISELHKQNLNKGTECYDADIHYPLLLQLRKPPADDSSTDDTCSSPE